MFVDGRYSHIELLSRPFEKKFSVSSSFVGIASPTRAPAFIPRLGEVAMRPSESMTSALACGVMYDLFIVVRTLINSVCSLSDNLSALVNDDAILLATYALASEIVDDVCVVFISTTAYNRERS